MATKKISNTDLDSNDLSNKLGDIFGFENTKRENVTSFEEVPLSSIKLDPKDEFTNLFPLDEENITNISNNMKKKSFRKSQALTLITIENENIEFLGDGHNRREAALRAGIETVPVYRETYPTRKEAKIAMLELQLNRRQLTDVIKIKTVAMYRELLGDKKAENGSGKISEQIAEATGFSVRQVEKINTILNSEDESLKEEALSGKTSINQSEKKAKASKKEKSKFTNDNTTHLDAMEDTSGDPKPLTCHIEHPREDPNKLTPEQDSEQTKRRKEAYESGFREGFEKAFIFVLSEVMKGRTPNEIYEDERVKDLSEITSDFKNTPEAEEQVYSLAIF